MNSLRFLTVFLLLSGVVLADAASEDGVYLTRSEFEAFLQQYRNEQQAPPVVPPTTLKPCMAWKKGKFTFTPYGYINLSVSYETQKSSVGDFCVYAVSPDVPGYGQSVFYIDPRSTRLGMKVDGPGLPCWSGSKTQGVLEIDFQGSYTLRNRGSLMLRKAYVAVSDKNSKFLAGQDWEILSPLYPATLNYTAGAAVGNLGYRRAMLEAEHRFDLSKQSDFLVQIAMVDNVLRDGFNDGGIQPNVGSWPVIEGRMAYALGKGVFDHGKPITVGMSAHIGEQQLDFVDAGVRSRQYFRTWSLNYDFDVPITKKLGFKAEYFIGENLSSFEGGILQGIDVVRRDTVRAMGGWAQLQYQWTPKLQTNVAYMVDDPFNQDLVGGNSTDRRSRTYSHCIFVNVLYNWTDALMTGFEVDFWHTNWQRYDTATQTVTPLKAAEMTRFEFVTRYTF